MEPLVTIIVPVYKASSFIEKCAKSLMVQTYENIEYIFVNDCTPDNSIQLLETTIEKFPRRGKATTIINLERNQGHAHARNVALKCCHGEYVIQIDADDWIESTMIEKMLRTAIRDNSDIVACDFIREEKEKSIYWSVNVDDIGHKGLLNFKWILQYSAHWNKLIRTSLIRNNNVYCIEGTNNWVDVGQIVPLRFVAEQISVVNEGLYHYNAFNENSVSRKITDKRISDILKTAEIVYNFISSKSNGEYEKSLCFLLFRAKSALLLPERNEYKKWLSTFPQANRYIFSYPISSPLKVLYWLAAHHIYFPLRLVKIWKKNFISPIG